MSAGTSRPGALRRGRPGAGARTVTPPSRLTRALENAKVRALTLKRMQEARDSTERRAVGIRLLEAQPDLGEGLSPQDEAEARRHVVAVLEDVPPGQWD